MIKRILSLVLALCLVVSLAACGGKDNNSDDVSSGTESTEPEKMNNPLTVAQLELTDGTGGMSYVVTLKDEGFIIIDGGMGNNYYSKHSSTLFDYLFARTPKDQKPVILGWFVTHFHNDHVENVAQFLKEYADRLDVRGFYINSPGKSDYVDRQTEMEELVNAAMDAHPNADKHYLKKDEKLEFPHCVVDVLATSSNLATDRSTDPNSISAIFKMNFDTGKSFLVTGDTVLNRVNQLFDEESPIYRPLEELKCDIYQVPHHGRPLGSESDAAKLKANCEKLGVSIVFFPVPQSQMQTVEYYTEKKWADNYYLINKAGADVFHHTQTVTVNMEDLSYTLY